MATYKTILTVAGKALVAAAQATNTTINITTVVIGDGGGIPVTPLDTQVSVVREVYRNVLNSIGVNPADATIYNAEVVIPAAAGGFQVREIGFLTADGVLFAIGNTPQVYKPSASEGSFGDMTINAYFKVSNAGTVSVIVDPNISIATRTWVVNYAIAANILPGGLTNQFLAKRSNTDGDVKWIDPTAGVQIIVDTIEERQVATAGQTVVTLSTVTTHAAAIYINGKRLANNQWAPTSSTVATLVTALAAGDVIVAVQNEQTGMTDVLHAANNLQDVSDKAASLANLGGAKYATKITAGDGLSGGGTLAADRILSVTFAGTTTSTLAVRDDDPRMTDARTPKTHKHDAADITAGTLVVARGGTGNASVASGYFLTGNGTDAMNARSPLQVLSDIGAASASHTHNIADVNGLQATLDAKVKKSGDTMTGSLVITSPASTSSTLFLDATAVGGKSWAWLSAGTGWGGGLPAGTCALYDNNAGGGTRLSLAPNGDATFTGRITVNGTGSQFTQPLTTFEAGNGTGLVLNTVSSNSFSGCFMSFNKTGMFACNFGLGSDNALRVGGWSFGATSWRIVHEGLSNPQLQGTTYSTGGFQVGSSLKIKTKFKKQRHGLEVICRLDTFSYVYKKKYNPDGRRRIGVSAEQLAEIFPEAVSRDAKGNLTADYNQITVALVESVKALRAQVARLESRQ